MNCANHSVANTSHNQVIMVMGNFMTLRYNIWVIDFMIGVFDIGDFSIYPFGKLKDLFRAYDIWEISVALFE